MAKVELRAVEKRYPGDVLAVEAFDLTIADGEFVVLVGPSGCGKSTTLRMIAGLEEITAGEISIGDRVVNEVPPKDRDVAMVFQSYALYPHMTVFENMAFGLKLRKMPPTEIQRRVSDAAKLLELDDLLERKPKALSGGQRQRVAMGRAIVRQPAVFLFDEPLSNLDARLRVQMRMEIAALHRKLGATMIYVTHDQTEAMTLADRLVVMSQGRLQQVGTPKEVYRDPRNTFVAGFIGSPGMNFLPGEITEQAGAQTFHGPGGVSVGLKLREPLEGVASVGVRPEDITAVAKDEDGAGHIEHLEFIGAHTFAHLRVGKSVLSMRLPSDAGHRVGDALKFSFRRQSLRFFDTSGQALSSEHAHRETA